MPGLLEGAGDIDLERAEPSGERLQLRRVELLRGKAQDAVFAERPQHGGEVAGPERLRQIDSLDRRSKRLAGRCYFQHRATSPNKAVIASKAKQSPSGCAMPGG